MVSRMEMPALSTVIHLIYSDVAVWGYKAEGIRANGQGNATLIRTTKIGIGALQALLDNTVTGEFIELNRLKP